MDRLRELEIFIEIVKAGSLRQAALRLRRSPAAVTRALAQLEDRLGLPLIDRTTRRASPTDLGQELADEAADILESYRLLSRTDKARSVRGLVRVTAPTVFGRKFVGPSADTFLQQWPEASLELLLHDRYLDFIEHRLDVAVRLGPLPDSGLRVRRAGTVKWVTVASPDYIQVEGLPRHPAELAQRSTIAETSLSGPPRWTYEIEGKDQKVAVAPRLTSNDVDVQLAAARRGRGIARVLSYEVSEDFSSGSLVRLLVPYEPRGLPVHVVMAGGRHIQGRTRALADHLFNDLRQSSLS